MKILKWLVDHARLLLGCTAHTPAPVTSSPPACSTLPEEHGFLASTLTDGMVYTVRLAGRGRQGGKNSFEAELSRRHIVQKNSRPNHPTTCGKAERFQQTMKKWLRAQPVQPTTITELQVNHPGMSGESFRWKDLSHGTSLEVPGRVA